MVVNIVVALNACDDFDFIGIDGNGIKVMKGGFSYNNEEEVFEGYCTYGRTNLGIQRKINREKYYHDARPLQDKFIREMISEDEDIYVNKIIRF